MGTRPPLLDALRWLSAALALFRRAAVFVGKILKGAKPGELRVEQPAKFELFPHLKPFQALGLIIPRRSSSRPTR